MTKREFLLTMGLLGSVLVLGSTSIISIGACLNQKNEKETALASLAFEKGFYGAMSDDFEDTRDEYSELESKLDALQSEYDKLKKEKELLLEESLLYQVYSYNELSSLYSKEEPKEGKYVVLECGYGFVAKTEDYNKAVENDSEIMVVMWPEVSAIFDVDLNYVDVVGYYDTFEEAEKAALLIGPKEEKDKRPDEIFEDDSSYDDLPGPEYNPETPDYYEDEDILILDEPVIRL